MESMKQEPLFDTGPTVIVDNQLAQAPPKHQEPTLTSGNQLREGDKVRISRRGEQRNGVVMNTKGGLFVKAWGLNDWIRFYKNSCYGPHEWRITEVLERAPVKIGAPK
jgi:hypothetical protein